MTQDREQAFALYNQAAAQGHVRAMNLVGRCHEEGWATLHLLHKDRESSACDGDRRSGGIVIADSDGSGRRHLEAEM